MQQPARLGADHVELAASGRELGVLGRLVARVRRLDLLQPRLLVHELVVLLLQTLLQQSVVWLADLLDLLWLLVLGLLLDGPGILPPGQAGVGVTRNAKAAEHHRFCVQRSRRRR